MNKRSILYYWVTWMLGMVAGMFLVLPNFEGNGAFAGFLVWFLCLMLVGVFWALIMSTKEGGNEE